MQTFKKQAWEFVRGEKFQTGDGVIYQIMDRQRDIIEGTGAVVIFYVLRIDEPVEDVKKSAGYIKFYPTQEMIGVTLKDRPETAAEKLDRIRGILDTEYKDATHWEWISGGLGGPLYGLLREVLG